MIAKIESECVRLKKSLRLLESSVQTLPPFDPNKVDDPVFMQPFDALSARFERALEIAVGRLFRSIELYSQQPISSNLRERLQFLEKSNFLSSIELWMEMREFRNKIAHDYLPDQIAKIYLAIESRFLPEMLKTLSQILVFIQKEKAK